ncbi:MAG TPA: hypothetical protein VEZ20_07510 [Allosphingosinicella sp.]|nr:hypothetical protein [Allosphingosinicella sp.]
MSSAPADTPQPPAAPGAGKAGPFATRTVVAIVVAGIAAFILFILLSAFAGHLRGGGGDPRAHALSRTAIGFQGLVRLVELGGGRSRIVRDEEGQDTEDLLVVTVEAQTDPERLAALLGRRQEKATLVILPKWDVVRDPNRRGRVLADGLLSEALMERVLDNGEPVRVIRGPGGGAPLEGQDFLEGIAAPAPRETQAASHELLTPLLTRGDGAVLAQWGESPHFLLADPDLMNNHGLADPAAARAAIEILNVLSPTGAESIAFDLTLNGLGTDRSPLRLALEPPFLPLTLALFVAALLAGLHGAFRFGAPAEAGRAIAFGKSQLVENSAGLFKLARREHRAGGAYAELVRETAAHQSGAHLALGDAELDAYLDRVSPEGRPKFSQLAARARDASDSSQLLAAARALFQWKKDLIK